MDRRMIPRGESEHLMRCRFRPAIVNTTTRIRRCKLIKQLTTETQGYRQDFERESPGKFPSHRVHERVSHRVRSLQQRINDCKSRRKTRRLTCQYRGRQVFVGLWMHEQSKRTYKALVDVMNLMHENFHHSPSD